MYVLLIGIISAISTLAVLHYLIPRFKRRELLGIQTDDGGYVPEIGGLTLILGFTAGVLLVIGFKTFFSVFKSIESVPLLMALLTAFIVAQVGLLNDLIDVNRAVRALVPLYASIPLVMVESAQSSVGVPLLSGRLELGLVYPLVLIPLGVTGAANAVNLFSGFDGLAAGTGAIALFTLGLIAHWTGSSTALLIIVAALGSLLTTLYYNWYPAKVLLGNLGTYVLGIFIASAVILGNFEWAGVIVIFPYFVDFLMRARHGFSREAWEGEYRQGKLLCPEDGPKGLAQLVMKLTGGISERGLVLVLMGVEAAFGALALIFYWA